MAAPRHPDLTDELIDQTADGLYYDYALRLTNNGYTVSRPSTRRSSPSFAALTPAAREQWRQIAANALRRVLPDGPDPTDPWNQPTREDAPDA